jgi:hypothetical protein
MTVVIFGTSTRYVAPVETVLERIERLATALNAMTEGEIYAAFDLEAPALRLS